MTIKTELRERSSSACELCSNADDLSVYSVPPDGDGTFDQSVVLCGTCLDQINGDKNLDIHHWRCLNDSMWSQIPAVQVMAWRMLDRLSDESWARDLLDMLYLDDDVLAWAKALSLGPDEQDAPRHKDSFGAPLAAGDTVTVTKDLNVKGTSFTAKRGTAVRGISLVPDNEKQIEGRINSQQIVILTEFVKKSG